MALKLFNALGKKKETFKPINKGDVRMYTCGPTVYNFAHLGNFKAYLTSDVLRRYLEYRGYKVKQVMNITDVDDKTIRDSQKEKKSLKEFTGAYANAFMDDMGILNIEKPTIMPKATEHIKEMVELIKKLTEKGIAYKAEDNSIYYNIRKFMNYGKLSGVDLSQLKAGARVSHDEYEKEQAQDFVLWKAWDEADGNVFWETELGKGRPGWHIECSAMSMKYLGESFDIHTGGIDLIFPHHENEIAQSEGVTGKKFVNYWLHNAWLLVEGKKMAKRYNNFFTLRDILAKGHSPKAVRYLLMSAQYRTQLNFTEDGLKDAETTVNRLIEFMDRLNEAEPVEGYNEALHKEVESAKKKFEKAMDDDLNTPVAFAAIHELVKAANTALADDKLDEENINELKVQMEKFDKVLGILKHEKAEVTDEVKMLVQERELARAKKDFKKSDALREKIRSFGWEVQDTEDGPKLIKKV